jgi:hypothetical protein
MPGKVSTLMAAMANLLRLKSMFALAAGEAGECQPARRSLACRTSKRQPWTATSFDLPGAKIADRTHDKAQLRHDAVKVQSWG